MNRLKKIGRLIDWYIDRYKKTNMGQIDREIQCIKFNDR